MMWLLTRPAFLKALIVSFLLCVAACAQQAPTVQKPAQASAGQGAPSAKSRTTASAEAVALTQPVITIHGLCPEGVQQKATDTRSCDKVITREQFEKLERALDPGGQSMPPQARQKIAQLYAEYLDLEAAARASGAEDTPEFRLALDWVRLRTAAELFRLNLREKYRNPSPKEIDAYYREHLADFDRVKLARILIPRESRFSSGDKSAFDKKALDAANAARERAARGEDPEQIQKDAYAALGLTGPPATGLGTYARENFIEKEGAEVFSLKPGEVTQVETEPRSYVIYKVLSKETLTKEQVTDEISRLISQQKYTDAIKAAMDAAPAEFNEQYFGQGIVPPGKVPPPARPPAH